MQTAENEFMRSKKGKLHLYARSKDRIFNAESHIQQASQRLQGAEIRRGDGWTLAKTAGDGDLVLIDTSYLNKKTEQGKTKKTANYNKATEEDAVPEIYQQKITDNLLDAWDKGAKLVITNNWDEGVASFLTHLGFTVIADTRAQGVSNDTRELIATNFNPVTGTLNARRNDIRVSTTGRAANTAQNGRGENALSTGAEGLAGGVNQESGAVHRSGAGGRGLGGTETKDKVPVQQSPESIHDNADVHSKGENVDEDTKSSNTLGRADEITQDKLTTKGTTLADKATDNGTALFSKASILSDNAKPDGITESQANAAIATFKRDFGNIDGVEFKVYKTLADAIGESEAKKIGRVKGFYLPNSKTIAIIRDALHHVQDAAETLRHETLGHFGLNLLKPADKLAFLGDIARSKNNLFLREMFAEVVRNYPELANDEFMQAEEVFAKVAEEQPSELTQWLDKQLLKLLGLFRKIGFLKGYVTKADMRDIAKSLAEGIRRGDSQKTFPKNNHSQFSKSTLPKLRVNLSNVTESGGHFETGVPVTFKYVHNTASYTALLGKKGY